MTAWSLTLLMEGQAAGLLTEQRGPKPPVVQGSLGALGLCCSRVLVLLTATTAALTIDKSHCMC